MNVKDFHLKNYGDAGRQGMDKHLQKLRRFGNVVKGDKRSEYFSLIGDLILESSIGDDGEEQVVGFLKEAMGGGTLNDDELLDLIWFVNLDLENFEEEEGKVKEFKQKLSDLVLELLKESLVDKSKVMERMENQLLGDCGLVELSTFQRRQLRFMTKLIYEQHKYNLFREESEGYSKLVIELLQISDESDASIVTKNLESLIGYFDLDPNRVIDIILECFIHNYHSNIYIDVIKNFKREYIPHILGFRFQKYGLAADCSQEVFGSQKQIRDILYDETTTPEGLYRVTAKLMKFGLVLIEEIWPHLSPSDEVIKSEFNRRADAAFHFFKDNYIQRMTITGDQIKKEKEDNLSLKNLLKSQYPRNQKFWILEALLKQNDYTDFLKAFKTLKEFIDVSCHKQLRKALLELISWFIEPAYRHLSPTILSLKKFKIYNFPVNENLEKEIKLMEFNAVDIFCSVENVETYLKFMAMLLELLNNVKGYLSYKPVVFTKICRVIIFLQRKIKEKEISLHESGEESELPDMIKKLNAAIYQILDQHLLSSLPGFDANPGVVSSIWRIISEFNFIERYKLYDNWIMNNVAINPVIVNANGESIRNTRLFMKIIRNDKEVDKFNARIFAKLSHNSPCVVFNEALGQMKQFNNMIPIIITSFNYCSNLSLDIAVFLTLRAISEMGKRIFKEEEAVVESWFVNMAHFLGMLLKKHYRIDLEGIFIFLCNKLCSEEDIDQLFIVLFDELIANMSGYETLGDFTDNQLKSLSGGIALQTESFRLTEQVRSAKKSSKALSEFFWKTSNKVVVTSNSGEKFELSLPFYLLALIVKQRSKILFKSRFRNPAIINSLYDKVSNCIQQFDLFLQFHSESNREYMELLPNNVLHILISQWKISHEFAYHMVRNSIKTIYKFKDEEWTQLVDQYRAVHDNFDYKSFYDDKKVEGDKGKITEHIISERSKLWNIISPQLYTLFWVLKPEHIHVPDNAYQQQIKEMNDEITIVESKKEKGESKSKIAKDTERIKRNIEILNSEWKNLKKEKEKIDEFLLAKKEDILKSSNFDIRKWSPFIQYCLLPRLRISAKDSIFCVRFIEYIHYMRESSFIIQINFAFTLLINLLPSIQCCSENEAYNLGVFFKEILELVKNWNDDYRFLQDIKDSKGMGSGDKDEAKKIQNVKLIVLLMFNKFTGCIEAMLGSKNFMQLRNIVVVLSRMMDIYPNTKASASRIISAFKSNFDEKDIGQGSSLDYQAKSYRIALMNKKNELPSIDIKKLKDRIDNKPHSSESSRKRRSRDSKDRSKVKRDDRRRKKDDKGYHSDKREKRYGRDSRPRHSKRKYDDKYLSKRKDYPNDAKDKVTKKLKVNKKGGRESVSKKRNHN